MQIVHTSSHIVECLRIAQMVERHGDIFLRRVFTDDEVQHCSARRQATQHYAAHWAAKEAVLKVLRMRWEGSFDWRDIEIRPDGEGAYQVALAGDAREVCARKKIAALHLSVSYCRSHAIAHVVAVGE